jgi:hypothetical protein
MRPRPLLGVTSAGASVADGTGGATHGRRHDPYASAPVADVAEQALRVSLPPAAPAMAPTGAAPAGRKMLPPHRRPERAPVRKARVRVVARLFAADAGTHAVVRVRTSAPMERSAVVAALASAAGGPGALDLRELAWDGPAPGVAGQGVIAIRAASQLSAATLGPRGPLAAVEVAGVAGIAADTDTDDVAAAARDGGGGPRACDEAALPRYVPADPKSHVWLAVGQVGFDLDQAAVCGMLRAACAPVRDVALVAVSDVPKKRGGRSGLWNVLVGRRDAAVLLARHGCLRFVSESEYVCFDTPAEAAACEEAHVGAPVTIELMRGPLPAYVMYGAGPTVPSTCRGAEASDTPQQATTNEPSPGSPDDRPQTPAAADASTPRPPARRRGRRGSSAGAGRTATTATAVTTCGAHLRDE